MQTYLKSKPSWVQVIIFLGMALGCFTAIFLIGQTVLSAITGIRMTDLGDIDMLRAAGNRGLFMLRGTFLVQFLGLFLVPSLLFSYYADPRPGHYLGLKRPWHLGYWVLGIAALLVAMPLVEYLGQINRQLPIGASLKRWIEQTENEASATVRFLLEDRSTTGLILNLIFVAAFAGIGEELFFRGVLQRLLIRGTRNAWAGILITAALFSFFHFQFYGFFPRLLLGMILGAIYWYSGSLWTAILAHFLYDAVLVVLLHLRPDMAAADATVFRTATLIPMALGSAGLVAFLIWTMKRRSATSFGDLYAEELHPNAPDKDLSF